MTLPIAHAGHYAWALYLLPVLIVAAAILRSAWIQKRHERQPPSQASSKEEDSS